MLKVLHVITTLGRGGIERWLISMAEHLQGSDCGIDFCCKGSSVGVYASRAADLGCAVHLLPLRVTHFGFLRGLRELATAGNYDIVHNHLHAYSGLPVIACRDLGIPVITSFHVTDLASDGLLRYPIARQLREIYAKLNVRYAAKQSAVLTGCSQGVVDSIQRSYAPDLKTRNGWRVIYYGIDLPDLPTKEAKKEFRAAFGWSEDTPVIVHVGRFAPQKNHVGLLQVFERLHRTIQNAKLLLIGGGPLHSELERMVENRGLAGVVRFLGYRDDVPAVLSYSDLFLFPSWFEGLPVAILEASAAALPVVASRVSGIVEAVDDGTTGLLRDPNDIEAMAGAAELLLLDRKLGEAMGSRGRARVIRNFSKPAAAEALTNLYHECAN